MKIIEITGVAGVGKSYIINLLSERENTLLDKNIIREHHLSDFNLLIYFFKNNKSFDILLLTFKIAFSLRMSLFHKLNFVRNTMKKFGKNYFITKELKLAENQTIIIDEGISHLYQNIITQDSSNHEQLLELINKIVDYAEISHTIIIVKAKNKIIFERLKARGHKRIKDENEIENFITMSKHNIKILKRNFNDIVKIKNNRKTNLEKQLNKI